MELSPFWSDLGNWDSMTTVALCTVIMRGGGEGGREGGRVRKGRKFLQRSSWYDHMLAPEVFLEQAPA